MRMIIIYILTIPRRTEFVKPFFKKIFTPLEFVKFDEKYSETTRFPLDFCEK